MGAIQGTIRLSSSDIDRVDEDIWYPEPYLKADGSWVFPKEMLQRKIHLSHRLENKVCAAYMVKSPDFELIGYLAKDGLTIIEY